MNSRRVLITGGAGFIGSHLAEALLQRGQQVFVLDDLSTGRYENISHLLGRDNFYFVQDSILNELVLRRLIDNADLIYHFAAAVGVQYSQNILRSLEVNIRGTENVLELASRQRKKVIIASSSDIYGKNGQLPFKEDTWSCLGPTKVSLWGNAWSKALDEYLAFAYLRERDLPVVVIRFFNVCGPRQTSRSGKVLPRFVKQALLGIPITIYGDGKQVRGFTDIEDALYPIMELAESPRAVGEIFNLGNPQGITIEELAHKVKELTRSPSKIIYIPYEQVYGRGYEDTSYRVADITKLQQLTGYQPRISLETLIQRVAHFIDKQLSQDRKSLKLASL